ncbi:MAG: enoyl-CoA hydratase/isomerase family protein [Porticoccaceae bacterium]
MSQDFTFAVQDGCAIITFSRPEKANAFHPRMIAPLRKIFLELRERDDVRVVLIRGEGKHFMAGGDLESISDYGSMTKAEVAEFGENPIHDYNFMIQTMQRLDQPVVASVQGGAAGAAMGFIGACDLVIAADTSFIWAAHILHGGSNDGLTTYFLPRHIGLRRSLQMALLGDRINAQEAKDMGLVNFVVPEAQLQEETEKLVKRLVSGPTKGYGLIKKLMYASQQNSMMEQGTMEAQSYGQAMQTEDVPEGLKAFFEKRKPNFKGK